MNKVKIIKIVNFTKNLRVLFIEDDEDSRLQTLKMFQNFFTYIETAVDGLDALKKFKSTKFDIIFSDINMPKLNGLEFIEEVRKINSNIPIIMISAYDNTPYFLKCIEIGVEGYLIKPIDSQDFLTVLEKIIDKSKNSKDIVLLEGNFSWDRSKKQLYHDTEIKLTSNERKFLSFLIEAKGRIKTYMEIDLYIYDEEQFNDKKIRNLVARLRKKVGNIFLESIYAEGYRVKIIS